MTHTITPTLNQNLLRYGGSLMLLLLLGQLLSALLPTDLNFRAWGPRVFVPLIPLVTGVLIWVFSRALTDYTRRFWGCIACFCGLYSVTAFISGWFGYNDQSLHSVNNIAFACASFFLIAAFTMLVPFRIKGATEVRLLLELLIITIAEVLILWCVYQAQLFDQYRQDSSGNLTTLFAFQAFNLFVGNGVVLAPVERRAFPRWLAGGLTFLNVTTISFLSQVVSGNREPVFWMALMGSMGFVLFLVAIVSQFLPEPGFHQKILQVSWYLPQISFVIAVMVFVYVLTFNTLSVGSIRTAIYLFASITPLIFVRQLITELQNRRLNMDLQDLNSTLEIRISERSRELESSRNQLMAAERLASLGQLTAGLAHEVNTPLAAAMTSFKQANTLVLEYRDSIGHVDVTEADHREIVQELEAQMQTGVGSLERLGEIVRKMRGQTRQQSEGQIRSDLSALLADTLDLLQHAALKAHVKLVLEVPAQVWWSGAPGRMSQVVTNLVMNAIHACEDANATNADRGRCVRLRLQEHATELWLEVIDDGAGIPESVRDRVFEPLFSTKDAARGTGLGLPIVRDIVTSHFEGVLEFETSLDHGTTFRVRMPRTEIAPVAPLMPSVLISDRSTVF
jgi:signal transduction histidine kinase